MAARALSATTSGINTAVFLTGSPKGNSLSKPMRKLGGRVRQRVPVSTTGQLSFTGGERGGGRSLRWFLDTASVRSWEKWLPSGMFYGVTTNPTILEKDGVPCDVQTLRNLASTAFELGAQEIQLQSWGTTTDELVHVGELLASAGTHAGGVVIKLPSTREGINAAAQLIARGHRVTMTAVYGMPAALAAMAVGADYAAPYLGRMNDNKRPAVKEILGMQKAVAATGSHMRILVASIRDVREICDLAAEGVDTFTFSPAIAEALLADPLTDAATADFQAAAERNKKRVQVASEVDV